MSLLSANTCTDLGAKIHTLDQILSNTSSAALDLVCLNQWNSLKSANSNKQVNQAHPKHLKYFQVFVLFLDPGRAVIGLSVHPKWKPIPYIVHYL